MDLTKAAQVVHASSTNAAGATTNGSGGWLPIGYGVSGLAKITNGAVGPTVPCDFILEVANDAAGAGAIEIDRRSAHTVALAVYRFRFGLGLGGNGGDFSHYRVSFAGNTVQAVTVDAAAMTTTAL